MAVSDEAKTSSFSFKLSSKSNKFRQEKDSHFSENVSRHNDEEKDFILSAEGQELQSSKPKKDKSKLVIPLIVKNKWRVEGGELDQEAVNEILQELRNDEGEEANQVIQPILMKNRVPTRSKDEEDGLNDLDIRPEESTAEDYDNIPIVSFGSAMLRGMGWSEGQGIGLTNKSVIEPIEYIPRHKGLGLGAEKRMEEKSKRKRKLGEEKDKHDKYTPIIDEDGRVRHRKTVGEEVKVSKPLGYYPGTKVQILKGPHKELYGEIVSVDEDTARISVNLAISGELIQISEYNTTLIDNKSYKELSKQKPSSSKSDRRPEQRREEDEDENKSKSKKKRKELSESDSDQPIWISSGIRVRIISKSYKDGRYYNKKVKILDVTRKDRCNCETDERRLLEDLRQSDVETVIPKNKGSYLRIVGGKYKGKFGKLLERNKRNSTADVQLTSNKHITTVSYDDICEYVDELPDDEFL